MPLGWNISVYRQQNGGMTPASAGAPHGARLAVWQAGLGGLDWLNDLVTHQKAISLGGNGYPIEYTATADHILPRLRAEPPGAKARWTFDEGRRHPSRMAWKDDQRRCGHARVSP